MTARTEAVDTWLRVTVFHQGLSPLDDSAGLEGVLEKALKSITGPNRDQAIGLPAIKFLSQRVYQLDYALTVGQSFNSLSLNHLKDHPSIRSWESRYSSECVFQGTQTPSTFRSGIRHLQLAVFDLDSTLIEQEVIDELARTVGKYEAVAAITESAMRGEIDFSESLKRRVALLKGVPQDVFVQLRQQITFAEGARDLCRALGTLGVEKVVISGGFMPMALWVKDELDLTRAIANSLETAPPNGEYPFPHLTGKLEEGWPLVNGEVKQKTVEALVAELKIEAHGVMCVGDGANDLLMLNFVALGQGIGVAFKAKPRVQLEAPCRLNSKSLADLLFLFGYDETQVNCLCQGKTWYNLESVENMLQ